MYMSINLVQFIICSRGKSLPNQIQKHRPISQNHPTTQILMRRFLSAHTTQFYAQNVSFYGLSQSTVLPAKSDSDVLFVFEVIRDLESVDHLCINPIHRIGLIHR